MAEWLKMLGYGAEQGGFEILLSQPLSRKFPLYTQQKMGTFYELGKGRQGRNGLEWLYMVYVRLTHKVTHHYL